jgi:hypothetical protein
VKVGGGLNYCEGPMGAGKTFYGVRRIVEAMLRGQYAVTNVELRPGWEKNVVNHVARFRTPQKKARMANQLAQLYRYEEDLEAAMKYRLPGSGEARGIFLWDEGQNVLNNREWKAEGRKEILMWSTQLRKLGFVGFLLSQHADNTDAALRRVCNFRIRLQNQREQTRAFGVRVTPWPLFLAVWTPANTPLVSKVKPVKVERYFLSWHRHLYDTFGLFHGLAAPEEDDDLIYLPALGRGAAPKGLPAPMREAS